MKKPSPAPSPKRRVLVVDDHPILRSGLALIINQQKDLVICGEADDALEAIQCFASAKPDLVVVDISLEGKSGLELIKEIQALRPEVAILVVSMHDEAVYAERVLRAGARGYVMKKSGGEEVLKAIRQVLSGRIFVSEKMAAQFLEGFRFQNSTKRRSAIEMLTDRELEVFRLIGEGSVTREIARRLHISPKTVDVHRQNLKQKFKLPSTTSLIQHAVRWVETESPDKTFKPRPREDT